MKKKLLIGLLGAAGGLGIASSLVSCSDTFSPTSDSEGKFIVSLNLDKDVVTSSSNKQSASESRAAAQSVSASDLSLKLTSVSGSFSRVWETAGDFSDPVSVPVGDYTLEAYYGSLDDEGFEKPYYYGSSSLTVEENRTTPISVSASLANSMVRLEMSDDFKDYFASYSVQLRSELGNEIDYPNDETRSVYLAPGQVTATITITKQNGTTATLEPKSFTAEARHSYVLKFTVNNGEFGDGSLVLTYDEMTDTEDVEIDLSDAILNAPAPHLSTDGFTSGDSWTQVEGVATNYSPKVTAIAQAGIDGVILSTNSAYLKSLGCPGEIDLVNGDASSISLLTGLGLKVVGTTKPEKMAYVDFTNLLKNIKYVDGEDNTSTFTVQVRDKNSRVAEQSVNFSVETETATLLVTSVEPLYEEETSLTFYIKTNIPDISSMKVEMKNDRGTWESIAYTATASGSESGVYTIVATVPNTDDDLLIRLSIGNLQTSGFTVAHQKLLYTLSVVNEFAHNALVDINYVGGSSNQRRRSASRSTDAPESVSFVISTDGGKSWSNASATAISSTRYKVTGLSEGVNYSIRATCDGSISRSTTVATESAPQLPYSDMETWVESSNEYDTFYLGSSSSEWGTNNPMTTSQGNNRVYQKISGTISTTDCHGGSKAALIRTCAWGSTNTTAGTSASIVKYIDAGLLHLGENRTTRPSGYSSVAGPITTDDLSQGMEFTSRPSALTFWYKYTAKDSSDHGVAEVYVYDALGNVIAQGTKDLTAVSSYTEATISLDYAETATKAAKIYVKFLSTYSRDFLSKSSSNINWSTGGSASLGSKLYLDDLNLSY